MKPSVFTKTQSTIFLLYFLKIKLRSRRKTGNRQRDVTFKMQSCNAQSTSRIQQYTQYRNDLPTKTIKLKSVAAD